MIQSRDASSCAQASTWVRREYFSIEVDSLSPQPTRMLILETEQSLPYITSPSLPQLHPSTPLDPKWSIDDLNWHRVLLNPCPLSIDGTLVLRFSPPTFIASDLGGDSGEPVPRFSPSSQPRSSDAPSSLGVSHHSPFTYCSPSRSTLCTYGRLTLPPAQRRANSGSD